jgi:hypothetical protein
MAERAAVSPALAQRGLSFGELQRSSTMSLIASTYPVQPRTAHITADQYFLLGVLSCKLSTLELVFERTKHARRNTANPRTASGPRATPIPSRLEQIHNEPAHFVTTADWRAVKLWQHTFNESIRRLTNASILQTAIQVPANGLRDGFMGDVELDNNAEEGFQINILSCTRFRRLHF